jgi:hypothetical protein
MMNMDKGIKLFYVMAIMLLLSSVGARAQTGSAGHCVQIARRSEAQGDYYNLRNMCSSTINVVWAVMRPNRGDFRTGNYPLAGGETHKTQVPVGSGIQPYACFTPQYPRAEDGSTITELVNGYSCR